jgi:hypothetical protein
MTWSNGPWPIRAGLKIKTATMYQPRFIQYLNLPPIPNEILASIPQDFALYQGQKTKQFGAYLWSDAHNEQLNQW